MKQRIEHSQQRGGSKTERRADKNNLKWTGRYRKLKSVKMQIVEHEYVEPIIPKRQWVVLLPNAVKRQLI